MRRLFATLLSVLLTLVLAPTAALAHGGYADPSEVTVGPGEEFASWTGDTYLLPVGPAGCPGPGSPTGSAVCDYLDLQVAADGKFWGDNDGGVEIVISWDDANADFDLTVYDGEGNEVATSAEGGPGPERVVLDEPVGAFTVEVTPWLLGGPTSYEGTITFTAEEDEGAGGASDIDGPLRDQPCIDGVSAGTFDCDGLDLAAFLPLDDLGALDGDEGSDIWGWTDPDTGAEIAIMGLTNGTTFIDVTDPIDPQVLAFIDNPSPLPSIWHDYKVLGNHVYGVSESDLHELQIFDLTRLRDVTDDVPALEPDATIPLVPGDAHNIAINEETGRIYSVGTNACQGGALVYDVDVDGDGPDTGSADPLDPTFLGCIAEDGYTHDAQCVVYDGLDADHTGKEICVNSNEDTLTVVDVTEVGLAGQNTVQLSRMPYENAEYSHQGWLTEDHRYFLLGDELDEQNVGIPTTTYIWDLTDLDAPVLLNNFEHATASIDHNLYIRDGLAYMSNYTAGLRIQDLGRVGDGKLDEVAYFDTYPPNDDATFNGTWSNYPYFDSGTIVVTGINEGLFVLTPSADDPTDDPTDDPSDDPTDDPSDDPTDDPSDDPTDEDAGPDRLAGPDRFATAAVLSEETFRPGVDTAYIATGQDFPDALAGGALAAASDAPILLVERDGIPDVTAAELARLEPGRIVVLGGTQAVGEAVRIELAGLTDGTVSRLSGADRYETAAAIAEAFPSDVAEVFVATGRDFPDALAGGALAASRGAPVVLTEADALPATVRTTLERLDVERATVLGGDEVVSEDVAEELASLTGTRTMRLAGADRFATMAAIVRAYDPAPKVVFVATGLDFPDALTAVPVVASNDAALVLVRKDEVPAVTAQLLDDLDPDRLVVVGGPSAVTSAVETALRSGRR